MNRKNHSSVDGFIPRRANTDILGEYHSDSVRPNSRGPRTVHTGDAADARLLGVARDDAILGQEDVLAALHDIDTEVASPPQEAKPRRRHKKANSGQAKPPKNKTWRIIRWVLLVILLGFLSVIGFLAYKAIFAGQNIFQGNIFDIFQTEPLKQDELGRSNFLIVGTSDDDPGHPGADLTDSIIIVSINQTAKTATLFNVPRDLYVEYGRACLSGYRGKINAYFSCIKEGDSNEQVAAAMDGLRAFVGEILGLDIQYGLNVNHTVIKDAVNAVGGIDVDIQGSNGAPGILDRNFDWRCNYRCYYVKYDNGVHHLDGEHALFLSMARGSVAPTYGLANSNFDREKNQQKILIALRDKALSTGTLANVGAVTALLDAFGNNLRTNIEMKEIRTLLEIAAAIPAEQVQTIDFFDGEKRVLTTRDGDVIPSAGLYVYTELRAYIAQYLSSDPVVREEPHVTVLNGGGEAGIAQTEATKLEEKGFIVDIVANTPEAGYGAVEIYQITHEKTASAKALETLYGVTIKTTSPPVSVVGTTDFLIIIGPGS